MLTKISILSGVDAFVADPEAYRALLISSCSVDYSSQITIARIIVNTYDLSLR
jgi:hypothetical protein